jgi:ankyrin repeat protein
MNNARRLQCSFARSNGERSSTMLIVAGAPLDSVPDHRLCSFAASSVAAVHALIGRGVAARNLHDGSHEHASSHGCGNGGHDPAVLKRLVDVFGADLSARDCWGATCTFILHSVPMPMLFASSSAAGADFNTRDSAHRTPLHVAHRYECSMLLLAAGADVNARDESCRTAAHIAAAGCG